MRVEARKENGIKREKDRRELIEHSCGIYEEDSGAEDRAMAEGTEGSTHA